MAKSDPMMSLEGKTILITGGAGILGRHVVQRLLGAGARVAIVDQNPESRAALDAILADPALGIDAADWQIHNTDITDLDALKTLKGMLDNSWGEINVLINNAAAKSPNFFAPFAEFPRSDWDSVMAVNVTGAMHCCQVFGQAMADRSRGSIINTLSVYGVVAPDQRIYEGSEYEGRAINTPAIYSASKAALWGLTKYLSSYWGAQNVRVNAVTPGGIYSGQNETFQQRYGTRVPLGRMAQGEELPGAFIYLASDAASYVTGQNICVDGGLTVW